MNRALIYVLIPAALVAVTHAAMRWGAGVALPLGIVLGVVVVAGFVASGRREKQGAPPAPPR